MRVWKTFALPAHLSNPSPRKVYNRARDFRRRAAYVRGEERTFMKGNGFVALLCTGLLLIAAVFQPAKAQERIVIRDEQQLRRTITVTGNGEVSAAPDHAVVRLGATAQAEDAAAAQTQVNEIMQKALSAIEKVSIPRKSIRTSGLTLSPIYASPKDRNNSTEQKIIAYRAHNTIEVTVENIKLVGEVIDAGLKAGANRLEGVSFGLRDDLEERTTALTKAVDEARAKARTVARALDVPLGNVREVVEGGVHILRQERYAMARGMMAADAMQTPVEPGEVRIQASVTIHYDIGSGR